MGRRARRRGPGDRPPAGALALVAPTSRRRRSTVGDEPPLDPLGALAAAAGEPDAERWWDDLVEHRGDGEPVFDAVAEAMAAVRPGTVTSPFEELGARPTCAGIRAALADDAVGGRRVRGVARAGPRPGRVHGGGRRRHPARPPEGRRSPSRGCRGPIAASAGPRATAPALPAPAGTTTCSATRARRASSGSSSTPPTPCAAAGCRRRPTTSSPPRGWPRRWPRCAAVRGPGSPRCSTPPMPCSAGSARRSTSSSSATPSARCPPTRRRCRWPATSRRPSGRPGSSRESTAARSSSTCARRTACAARTCCTGSSRSACRGARWRRAGARAARSARRGGWRGSPSCRCASSSSPATARRRGRGHVAAGRAGRRAPAGWPTPPRAVELALLADLPRRAGAGGAARSASWRPTPPTSPS